MLTHIGKKTAMENKKTHLLKCKILLMGAALIMGCNTSSASPMSEEGTTVVYNCEAHDKDGKFIYLQKWVAKNSKEAQIKAEQYCARANLSSVSCKNLVITCKYMPAY
jgi:hypothetical protein